MEPENVDLDQLKRVIGHVVTNDVDIIYLPVFINNNHWLLAVVHLAELLIDVFDYLDGNNDDVTSVLLRRFSELYGHRDLWRANNNYKVSSIQHQNDNYNCAYAMKLFPGKMIGKEK
jgi:Ulp1 family protease